MNLLYFVLSAYGLTQLLCYGKIFDKIRPQGYFYSCPMCIGFWVGVFLCGVSPYTELFTYELTFLNFLICGWVSSGTSYILNMVFGDQGINHKEGGDYA